MSRRLSRFNPRAREGRDLCPPLSMQVLCRFNPRAREGRDARFSENLYAKPKFQSTRPRGARPAAVLMTAFAPVVSIHAPARGATCIHLIDAPPSPEFQSTRPRGARRRVAFALFGHGRFNPRAREGRDARRF